MPGSRMITQRDIIKEPQMVVEGTTVATYGVVPVNPAFIACGQDSTLIENNTPVRAEKRIVGDVDRREVKKTRENIQVTLQTKFMSAREDLLAWAMNKPNGVATPDESRTFLDSYSDDTGTERFRQYKGCKPLSYSLVIDNQKFITLEIVMSCKEVVEDTVGPTIGTGSFATALSGTPLIHSDGGAGHFVYNSVVTEIRGITINGTIVQASQDATGSQKDLYKRATQRAISGTVNIFKVSGTLQQDARDVTQRTASLVVQTGQITITFTDFLLEPSGEEVTGDTSDATIEAKNFSANAVVVA